MQALSYEMARQRAADLDAVTRRTTRSGPLPRLRARRRRRGSEPRS
ncbi:hypothetical protein [Euzebya sp.]